MMSTGNDPLLMTCRPNGDCWFGGGDLTKIDVVGSSESVGDAGLSPVLAWNVGGVAGIEGELASR